MESRVKQIINNRKEKGLFRQVEHSGISNYDDFIDFTHNSYLNLHEDQEVIDSGIDYASKFGSSAKSSILLSKQGVYEELNYAICNLIGKDGVVLFPSGYQMNATAIPAILNLYNKKIVITDKEIHASMHHGIKMAECKEVRYLHNDLNSLEDRLKANKGKGLPIFVFTESVFSMGGEVLKIEDFIFLKEKYGFIAYIDEAHAIGVFGYKGQGVCGDFADKIEVIAGTMGKSIASNGGFVSCSKALSDYLINFATGFIYSTAISPFSVGCAIKAIQKMKVMKVSRMKIFNNIEILKANFDDIDITSQGSQILKVRHDNLQDALATQKKFYEQKILTSLIRYPTIPYGQFNIRVSINSKKIVSLDIDENL